METIKPQDIKRGDLIADECNESVYTVLENAEAQDDGCGGVRWYIRALALTNWGSVIEYNTTYLPEDGELYCVSHAAPFAMPEEVS